MTSTSKTGKRPELSVRETCSLLDDMGRRRGILLEKMRVIGEQMNNLATKIKVGREIVKKVENRWLS